MGTTEGGSPRAVWDQPVEPSAGLLAGLKDGPFPAAAKDETERSRLIARLRRERLERPAILVGAGTCGLGAGAEKTIAAIGEWLAASGQQADVVRVGCVGLCSEEPIVDLLLPGRARISFGPVHGPDVAGLLGALFAGRLPEGTTALGQYLRPGAEPWAGVPDIAAHPFLAPQKRWVLENCGLIDPDSLDEYIARGGYSAMAAMLSGSTPDEVCDLVERSGLRGRGGGGFPTGRKWKFARTQGADQKYLICNADEGDPGAFMDRAVCESDPYRLLEGMVIAAYGIGASKAYIYIRAEYPLAVARLERAIEKAKEYGLLGTNILGSGFSLKITIKMGAGAFVCGEETALIHSIEGRRGMPRPRPPYPVERGLFGKPTVINNVETLANLPSVVRVGPEAFRAMGTAGSAGTKVFALSGHVNRTGLVEVPMGTPIRTVVHEVGGGIPGGRRCKAVQIGGPSGGCIPEAHLDLVCDYEELKKFGAIMGSGGLVVMDDRTCMVDLAKYFMEFIQSESCGKCIPCREGTKRLLEILQALTRSRRSEDDLDALLRFQGVMQLKRLAEVIKDSSLCGLGQTAPNPVLSTLRWFRDEYEAHIYDRRCPAGACKELVGAPCQTGCPVGTEVWRYVAHTARSEYTEAYRAIRAANPFPSVCARVCHHPCETACRAGTTGGEPIAIRTLKRYVVDHTDPTCWVEPVRPAGENAPKVAVIGAGPAGLTAANRLSLQGCRVTLFEREAVPGGMLTGAIPAYRLPRDILQKEIDLLLNGNIELRCNAALGRDITLDGLFADGYRAVYVATGAHRSQALGIPGEETPGVHAGVAFLKAYNLRDEKLAAGRVGVIGGGNSAIDAARAAIRQPGVKSVTVFYRRTQDEMPAYPEEIAAALEEGVLLEPLVSPVAVEARDGRLVGVRFIRNELGEPDSSGRRRPVPVAGSEFAARLDTLVVAISEQPEAAGLDGVAVERWGGIRINPESCLTSRQGVFAGGDAVSGPSTVIAAVAAGKQAALMIMRFLTGRQLRQLPKISLPSFYVEPAAETEEEGAPAARVASPHLPVRRRKRSFAEVELCVSESEAVCEARRCLRCDLDFTRPN